MYLSLGISVFWVLCFGTIDMLYSIDYANIAFYSISSIGGLLGYTYFPTEISPITGQWWVSSTLSQLSVSFFVFDILVCIRNKSQNIYILHGICGGIACSIPFYFGYFPKYWLLLMTYEFSSICLCASRLISPTNTTMLQINKILFVLAFFVFRIVFGTYISIYILHQIFTRQIMIESSTVNSITIFLALFFGILNYYWFLQIINKFAQEWIQYQAVLPNC